MKAKISVLICTRDRPDTIGQAIASVARCDYQQFDLHVLDQSTTDATQTIVTSMARRFAERCNIIYHHLDQPGLSRAYNAGVQVSDGQLIACTDDDVIVPSEWLSEIAKAFAADHELGLLYGQVLVPESLRDAVDSGTVVLPALGWARPQRLFHADRNFKVWGMGANMAMRRDVVQRVGGFDEALGGGAPLRSSQDFDFSFRTYRAGYAISLDPAVTVEHYGTRVPEQWPATERNYGIGDGAFYSKHVRCGDLLALRLFLRQIAYVLRQTVVASLRQRRPVAISAYGKSILTGIRLASRFEIDRQHRLYRETTRATLDVTEANPVTGSVRGHL